MTKDTTIVQSLRPARPPAAVGQQLSKAEAACWRGISGQWRTLYEECEQLGASIQWHDFTSKDKFEWSRSFHPDTVEICLNLAGTAVVQLGEQREEFTPGTAGFYMSGQDELRAWREAGQSHQFVTIELSKACLSQHLGFGDGALNPQIEEFLRGGRSAGVSGTRRLSVEQEQLVRRLQAPAVFQAARPLWYRGKVLEIMAEFFFERGGEDELFCDRQQRTARERVERVITILRNHLSEPPSLGEIGREVGCSPFHLSRTFSREMGMTIPQFLRKLRMERAGELLASGKHNVTEAAMEVGYSSLSHFSQAFCETMGCCPALYSLRPKRPETQTAKGSVTRR